MIKDLLGADHPEALFLLICFCIICMGSLVLICHNAAKERNYGILALTLLIGFSVLVIVAIDVVTTMYIRPRYYFMLYPLMSFLVACIHDKLNVKMKLPLLSFVIVFFCLSCVRNLPDVCASAIRHKEEDSFAISEYLLENGYTTIYALWEQADDVAIASNGEIRVGYWHEPETTFQKMPYLCNVDIYNASPDQCVYFFQGRQYADIGIAKAESVGVSLQLIRQYPESDIYLYTAPINLMQHFR